jgi:hypothetical protein
MLGASRRLVTGVTVSRGHVFESLWHQKLSQEASRLAWVGIAHETRCNVTPICRDLGIPVLVERSHRPDVKRSNRSPVVGPGKQTLERVRNDEKRMRDDSLRVVYEGCKILVFCVRVANFSRKGNHELPPKWHLYQDTLSFTRK